MTDEAVFTTRVGSVATIHLNRPAKRNAITLAMWRGLADAVACAEDDPAVRVIVVTGEGGAFAAGSDIAEFAEIARDPAAAAAAAEIIHLSEDRLHRAAKPTLAMIGGACVGAGCGVALACDVRFADTTARFGVTPARLGLVYGLAATKRLVDAVGAASARDILYTGRILDAAEAHRIGLIGHLAAPEDLARAVADYAAQLAEASAFSQRLLKCQVQAVLDGAAGDTPASRRMFADAITGPAFKEGHAAFMAKRPPNFPNAGFPDEEP